MSGDIAKDPLEEQARKFIEIFDPKNLEDCLKIANAAARIIEQPASLLADASLPALAPKITIQDNKVDGLPTERLVLFAGRISDDSYFVINRPTIFKSYDDYELRIGPKSDLQAAQITNVRELRDGGTTVVTCEHGQFYFPSKYTENGIPTFNKIPIELFSIKNT